MARQLKSSVLLAALLFAVAVGIAVDAYAANCSGFCDGCSYQFNNCTSCSIDEGSCDWSFENCSSVHIVCDP